VGQRDRCEGWSPAVSALHSPHCIFRSLSDRPSLLSPRLSIGLMHPCASVFPFRLARSTVITARSIHRHRSFATTEHSASLCPYSASPFVSSRFYCLLPRHPYAMTADRENYNTIIYFSPRSCARTSFHYRICREFVLASVLDSTQWKCLFM
jgi:hypothetical protein